LGKKGKKKGMKGPPRERAPKRPSPWEGLPFPLKWKGDQRMDRNVLKLCPNFHAHKIFPNENGCNKNESMDSLWR